MEAEIGVNSPDFLQKKIERLKTALDEANVLMDRQVTERDEARAQLDAVKRENDELRRQLEQGGGGAAPAAEPAAIDPVLENHLRGRIADLEAERESLHSGPPADDQVAALQTELDAARRDVEAARGQADQARRDADAARADAATARSAAPAAIQAPRASEADL
ncbi:MAG: hypothetical protein ACJ77Z_13765, partial [Thermoleophilaceae bacterium]